MALKILLINDRLHAGGVELVLQKLAAVLAQRGDRLTIWACEGDRKTLQKKYPAGVRYYHLPFWYGASRRFTPKWFFQRVCRVLFEGFFLRLKKWDVVIAFKEGPSMRLASKLRARRKLAWVHTDFGTLHWSCHSFHSGDEERACMQRFDAVACVSQTGARGVIGAIGDPGNLCVRYNPLDIHAISAASALTPGDCVRPEGKPLFVSVGRLSEIKRYAMLMDICKELEEEFDFELWIVGGGELEEELREKLCRENITSVRLLGRRDNPYPYVAAADWFINSSASECHPLAIQEALVLGVPVIAAYCPAVPETLDSRFGIITESGREGLKEGLRSLLMNPGAAAEYRENIRRFYDKNALWESRIQDILSLIDGESGNL